MSLTFGLFTQVSGSGPLGPLVQLYIELTAFDSVVALREVQYVITSNFPT